MHNLRFPGDWKDLGHDDADNIAPGIDPEVRRIGTCPEVRIQDRFGGTGRRLDYHAKSKAVLHDPGEINWGQKSIGVIFLRGRNN
jgi:hypothetical protein